MFLLFSIAVAVVLGVMLVAMVSAPARRQRRFGRPASNPAADAAYHARHGLSVCNNRHGHCPFPGVPQASVMFEIKKNRGGGGGTINLDPAAWFSSPACRECGRRRRQMRLYGDYFARIRLLVGPNCPTCASRGIIRLAQVIDHDHRGQQGNRCSISSILLNFFVYLTGHRSSIRGLLCNSCNRALGTLGDTVASLQGAVAYLQAPRYPHYVPPPAAAP